MLMCRLIVEYQIKRKEKQRPAGKTGATASTTDKTEVANATVSPSGNKNIKQE